MKNRILACAAATLVAATTVSLASCSSDADSSTDADQLSVLLDWNPNPDHLALYTADHTGAYEDHGVDPEFILPGNTADAAKLVSLGQADVAVSYETDTILAASQGLDVVSVGALIPTPLNSIITKSDSGIRTAKDLAGKTVAGSGTPSQQASMDYIARTAGIDPDSIEMPNVQQNLNQALLSDQVDAIAGAYPNIEGVELAEKTDITVLSPDELGMPDNAELVIIANPTRLKEDAAYADRVRGFLAGTAEGQDAALADPDTAVDAMTPETKGAYDPDTLTKMVDATVAVLRKDGTAPVFGVQDPADWAEYADWMRDNGLLDGGIDGATATTNDYLPA
ncbi:ABC transporter substrate-binding protein [Corynebacterium variabile]|uniref:ABC transporter substrate-binding protein n=1 Tax=Corynebacterium variabile TaxID=1727 RepID=UPI003CB2888E